MSKQIQGYPGHMSKTIREYKEISKKIDMFFILLDARAPKSSFVKSISEITEGKKVTIVFTKTDLVKKDELDKGIKYYKDQGFLTSTMNTLDRKNSYRKLVSLMKNTKVKSLIPKFGIIGVPNVGKSTLLNVVRNKNSAKTQDKAGITKKNSGYQIEDRYGLLDTPGILQESFIDQEQATSLAAIGSIKLEILPILDVVKLLLEKFDERGVHYTKEPIDDLPEEALIKYIKDFQKGKYGKIILDD